MAKYILFDTETTGTGESDRILQIGGMVISSKNDIEVYDELCTPPCEISFESMEIHNITPERVKDKPLCVDTAFYQKLQAHNCAENYLIAHNINFDLGMIEREGFDNHYMLIDTLRCSRHLFPDMPAHRLQYLRYALGLYEEEVAEAKKLNIVIKAHDAIGDVLVMKLFLSRLTHAVKEQFPDANIMAKLVELTKQPVMMKTFKFGKYKDREIADIANEDRGYMTWMRKNLDLDEDLAYTLDSYLL